jgi:hypothetical protein
MKDDIYTLVIEEGRQKDVLLKTNYYTHIVVEWAGPPKERMGWMLENPLNKHTLLKLEGCGTVMSGMHSRG